MVDGLTKIVQQIGALKLSPNADIDFLTQLETAILSYVHQQNSQGSQAQQGAPGFPPGASVPGMGGPGGPGGGLTPAGVPGVMQSPGMPNPDELRRMVGAAQQ